MYSSHLDHLTDRFYYESITKINKTQTIRMSGKYTFLTKVLLGGLRQYLHGNVYPRQINIASAMNHAFVRGNGIKPPWN